MGQALRASPVTAEKALSLEAVKCFRPVSLEETSEPRQLVAKNSQTISPHTMGGKGCGRAASSLPPRLCPGPGTPNSWVTRRRSLFHSMHRSVFLLQVTDFGENTYYSNFIAHLNNIRYPGEERPQQRQGGRAGGRGQTGRHTGPARGAPPPRAGALVTAIPAVGSGCEQPRETCSQTPPADSHSWKPGHHRSGYPRFTSGSSEQG